MRINDADHRVSYLFQNRISRPLLPRAAKVSSLLMFHELGNLVYGICRVTEIRQTKIGIEANNGTTCPRPTWLSRTRYVHSEKEDYPRLGSSVKLMPPGQTRIGRWLMTGGEFIFQLWRH